MNKFTRIAGLCCVFPLILACADGDKAVKKSESPWILELHVVPTKLTISPNKSYLKPFIVRAKYSNAVVSNVTENIQWASENTNLLSVNESGELLASGNCNKDKCPVSLVGTDQASGKSVRVTVNVKQDKNG